MSQQSFGEFAFQKTVSTEAVVTTLGCTPFFSGIFVFTWLIVSQLCQTLVHNVSSRLEVERELIMAFAGGSRISTQNARSFVFQCDVCDHVYFLVFCLPVTFHVRRLTQLRVCERRNLHITYQQDWSYDPSIS